MDQTLSPGTHLTTPRCGYRHHGLYVGDGRVLHYRGLSRLWRRGPVEEVSLAHFEGGHGYTLHSIGRYVDYNDKTIHTNIVEGYFSIFKRGMKGIYQHCAEKHLHRYLAEFDFRYNHRTALKVSDIERRDAALKGIEGKRLTYRRIGEQPNA